jgi:aspartyl protease family protein
MMMIGSLGARRCRVAALLLLLTGLGAAPAATGADVAVAGLYAGRAVLVVDGGAPQTVRVGGRTREGIVVRAVGADSATLEHEGRVFVARLGEQVASSAGTVAEEVSLQADGGGHFFTGARINGVTVNALVDTGATFVAIGRSDALRLGIDYRAGAVGQSATANGMAKIWKVRLDSLELEGVRVLGVDAAVHETDLPVVLLGMSFMNRMDWRRDGDRLLLKRRY